MRTSLTEIQEIENHLHCLNKKEEDLLFEAKLILEPDLKEKVLLQQNAYELIRLYGRKKLRAEIEMVHQKLFQENSYSSFKKKILTIFYR